MTEAAGTAQARTTEYTYDALDRRIATVVNPGGASELRSEHRYDANGNLVASVQAAGTAAARETRFVHDAHNREVYRIGASGLLRANVYDANGNVVETVAYANAIATAGLSDASSAADVQALITTASSDRHSYTTYSSDNRVEFSVDAAGFVSENRYDGRGLLQNRLSYSAAITIPAVVDSAAIAALLPANPTAAAARTESYQYDALGRVEIFTDALGTQTKTVYDDVGNSLQIIEAFGLPEQRTTERAYDARGAMIAETPAAGTAVATTTRYIYDALGNRSSETDARGVALAESDSAWAAAERQRLGYDALAANLTGIQRDELLALYTKTYNHDALGRVTSETDALGNTSSMAYDAFGNKVRVTDPNGNSGFYYFDTLDRQIYSIDPGGYLQENRYDAFGNVTDSYAYAIVVGTNFDENSTQASIQAAITADPARDRHSHYDFVSQRDLVDTITYS